jgi:hypothetical protein
MLPCRPEPFADIHAGTGNNDQEAEQSECGSAGVDSNRVLDRDSGNEERTKNDQSENLVPPIRNSPTTHIAFSHSRPGRAPKRHQGGDRFAHD